MAEAFFSPTITLDGVVTVLSIVGGGFYYILASSSKLTHLSDKVDEQGKKIDKLATIVEIQTRHDERLTELSRRVNVMDQRWEDMRHGRGLVVDDK